MDFYTIKHILNKQGVLEIIPDFKVCRSKDLMIRSKMFYAIWDEETNLWSTDEYRVQQLIDKELWNYKNTLNKDQPTYVKTLSDFSSGSWKNFIQYTKHLSDNSKDLDNDILFSNSYRDKKSYASKTLPYALEESNIDSYNELMSVLYDQEERDKIEWAIGSIISGEAKTLHKFIVLYGLAGTGKSTIINIIQKLFEGYYTTFDAKALTSNNNSFSTEVFSENPLVGIQHDGDLSKIEDNTKINSIVAHEEISVNEKYKKSYTSKINCFLFLGTNKPVRITDAKSGIIRRLIDVIPTGNKIEPDRYYELVSNIDYELGGIANHCLNKFKSLGKNYFSGYRPLRMLYQTDVFFNFVESCYYIFQEQELTTLTQAYTLYKEYCVDSSISIVLAKHKFREELKNYFNIYEDRIRYNDKQVRSVYKGFNTELFDEVTNKKEETPIKMDSWLELTSYNNILLETYPHIHAQLATKNDTPTIPWSKVTTRLEDVLNSKVHFCRLPPNHIVVDFDLKDSDGNKSLELNIQEASRYHPTYAEVSKSGNGLHLHYLYTGDINELCSIQNDNPNIEIKVFKGSNKSALRRCFTKSNGLPISTISSGLSTKTKGDTMIDINVYKNENVIRTMIQKNLKKEYHSSTSCSIDFIKKILDDAYNSGLTYDVEDTRKAIYSFALKSTNQMSKCLKVIDLMKFKSKDNELKEYENIKKESNETFTDDRIVFYDVECFKNLFLICWKFRGSSNKVYMINPKPHEVQELFKLKLVGFNNRGYDNHMIYAASLGYTNKQLYDLSQKIISPDSGGTFSAAYHISYTDIYDFSSARNKKSLKKWQIELGIQHLELGIPWDIEVNDDLIPKICEYCGNDVDATEAVFEHLKGDWAARKILTKLSGLTENHTTNNHSIKIVFGEDKNPQQYFNIPDLRKEFPGYKFEYGKSTYRGFTVGEGGFVLGKPHCYGNVGLLDIASMHPSTIEKINMFGKYTQRYVDLKTARLCIKHKDIEDAKNLLNGDLVEFLKDESILKDLSEALKSVLNSAYGLTFASFDNPFKHPDNIDNVVAKRGALFMVDLYYAIKEKGWDLFHIKTDSIKIADITDEMVSFVMDFGKKYGYTFEFEHMYDKLCLINDAVYVAKDKETLKWSSTGAQFSHPIVFKTMFSKEPIDFFDYQEVKMIRAANSAMYLDFNEKLSEGEHNYKFIGRSGSFVPIAPGKGGGILLRSKEDKYDSVTGTKGYRWAEYEYIIQANKEEDIDLSYYQELIDKAKTNISAYCDIEWFTSDEMYEHENNGIIPF